MLRTAKNVFGSNINAKTARIGCRNIVADQLPRGANTKSCRSRELQIFSRRVTTSADCGCPEASKARQRVTISRNPNEHPSRPRSGDKYASYSRSTDFI